MRLTQLLQAIGPPLHGGRPPGWEAWLAMLLISASTIAGAWLVRRDSRRLVAWLAIASATMLALALTDLLPDASREAAETGLPLWAVAASAVTGYLVITYFTRRGCGHGHGTASHAASARRHAPGRHRRLPGAVGAALFGGMGTAAALTTHRAIDGATLAFSASLVVLLALMVHSASEGLALAALLEIARRRLTPWLVISCVSPAAGVLFATVSPLPRPMVPILLGMVGGVLLRTAIVGIRLAAGCQAGGLLSKRQIAAAVSTAVAAGVVLTLAHGGAAGHVSRERAETQRRPGPATTPQAAVPPSPSVRPGTRRSDRPAATPARSSAPVIRHGTSTSRTRARRERSELLAAVRSGRTDLADVLRRDDEAIEHLRVGRLVRALPGRTPERATALMRAGDIDEKGYLGDLDRRQRRTLLDAFTGCGRRRPASGPDHALSPEAPAAAGDASCRSAADGGGATG